MADPSVLSAFSPEQVVSSAGTQSVLEVAASSLSVLQDTVPPAPISAASLVAQPVVEPVVEPVVPPIVPPVVQPIVQPVVEPVPDFSRPAWSQETARYVEAYATLIEQKFPVMYAQKPKAGQDAWRSKHSIFSDEFRFPGALQLPYHPELRAFAYSPASFELEHATLRYDDPMMFYESYMPQEGLRCPNRSCACRPASSTADLCNCRLERDGWGGAGAFRVETLCLNDATVRIHRVLHLRCTKCKDAGAHAAYTLFSEDVFRQLPPLVRAQYPYLVTSKSFVHANSVGAIVQLKLTGSSLESIETVSSVIRDTVRARAEIALMTVLQDIKAIGSVHPLRMTRSILASAPIASVISAELAGVKIVEESNRIGPFIQSQVQARGPSTTHLQIDHNFQQRGGNELGGRAFLHGMNQNSEVVIAVVTEGESLLEAKSHFDRIKNDRLRVVSTDHVKKDARNIKKLTNEEVRVLGDVFHWEKNVLEAVDAGDLFAQFALGLSLCMLVPVDADVCELETRLIAGGMPAAEARAKCLDPYFIRKRHDVRRRKLPKKDCLNRLNDHLNAFLNKKIFKPAFFGRWQGLLKKVEEFYEESAAEELFLNIGTAEFPHWIAVRGTNGTESFHSVLDKMRIANYGLQLQDACYVLCIGHWNHDKQVIMAKKRILRYVYDPTILNELVTRTTTLSSYELLDIDMDELPYCDWELLPPTDNIVVGVLAGQNQTNLSEAQALYLDREGDRSAFPRYKGSDDDEGLLTDVTPQQLTSSGRKLAGAMLESGLYYLKPIRKKIADGNMDSAKVWNLLNENTILKSIDLHALTLALNGAALDAMSSCFSAQHAGLPVPSVTSFGLTFPADDLRPTAPAHVQEWLAVLIKSKVLRVTMPTRNPKLSVVSAPAAESCVDGATQQLPSLDVANPLELLAPIQLPGVDPCSINPTPGSGTVSKRRRKTDEVNAAPVASVSNSLLSELAKCPHCPHVRRSDETHEQTCPFRRWTREEDASAPSRSFEPLLGSQPNALQAWKLAYLRLNPHVRRNLCTQYGCTLEHKEWDGDSFTRWL